MRKLKLLFIAGLMFGAFANAQNVIPTNSTGPALCDGSATFNPGSALTWTWYQDTTSAQVGGMTFSNLCAGSYSVQYSDSLGTYTLPFSIVADSLPNPCAGFSVSVSATNTTSGSCTGSVTATVNGGTGATYMWSDSSVTSSITNVCAGTYSVQVMDANGCSGSGSATVSTDSLPNPCAGFSVSVSATNTSSGSCTGSVTATVNGGTGATYMWSDSSVTSSITNVCAGTYSVQVMDANGCSGNGSATVYTDSLPNPCAGFSVSVSATNTSSGSCTGSVTATVNGGTAVTYMWSDSSVTSSITNVCAGTYSVQVMDANGCSGSGSATVSNDSIPNPCAGFSVSVSATNTSSGSCTGSVTATVNGGTAVTYMWSDSSVTSSITNVCAGTYSVQVMDANGCSGNGTATVYTDSLPNPCAGFSVLVSATNTSSGSCTGSVTATVNGGTGATYMWSDSSVTSSITSVCAGTYSVQVMDANGCSGNGSATVYTDSLPNPCAGFSVSVSATNTSSGSCTGSVTATVNGGTGATYMWSDSSVTSSITNVCAGTYSVQVMDANGCSGSGSATVSTDSLPNPCAGFSVSVSATNTSSGSCTGSVTATVNGGTAVTYMWSDSSVTSSITNVCAGTYSVQVMDANGCSGNGTATVSNDSIPNPCAGFSVSVSATNTSSGSCTGSVTATVNGGTAVTYMWSDSSVTSSITNVCAGTYSVQVMDANGCSGNGTATVYTDSLPNPCAGFSVSVSATNTTSGSCTGSVTATVNGGTGATYMWSDSSVTSSITNVCAGTYSVQVMDANGCSGNGSATVYTDSLPNPCAGFSVSVSATNTTSGSCTGSVTATVNGGTAVTYMWSDSSVTSSITNVCAGTYSVQVMDANGCSGSGSATVYTDSLPNPCAGVTINTTVSVTNIESGAGLCNGAATANAFGGMPPYSYTWNNSFIGSNVSGLCGGTGTVTSIDSLGCMGNVSYTIGTFVDTTGPCVGVTINVAITSTSSTVGNCDATAIVVATGGTAPYNYTWNNQYQIASITNLCRGDYSVIVVDANGCVAGASAFVDGDTSVTIPLSVTVTSQDATSSGLCDGEARVSVNGGNAPYAILFDNSIAGNQVNGLCAGYHFATVIDADSTIVVGNFLIASPATVYFDSTGLYSDSVSIATLAVDAVSNCSFNYDAVDSIVVADVMFTGANSINIQWLLYSSIQNDTAIYQVYSVGPDGIYTVVFEMYCDNGRTTNTFVKAYSKIDTRTVATGVNTVEKENGITVYPNPFTKEFTVSSASKANVTVKDITGRTVIQTAVLSGTSIISANSLAKGIYVVTIDSENGRTVQKLIKE